MPGQETSLVERAIKYFHKEGILPTLKLASFYGPSYAYHRKLGLNKFNQDGYDLLSEDWDNLIILDACRYDIFTDVVDFPGDIEMKVSRGSSTSEFIRANFGKKKADDTVYIAGNSWFMRLKDEIESEVYAMYQIGDNSDGNKIERTTECAEVCQRRHPNKRLLIHFIPPHHPFVGETADKHFPSYEEQLKRPLFDRIRRGDLKIDDDLVIEAYKENLERVLPAVEQLLESLEGKTVVTSDHGEMLGDRSHPIPIKFYGHIPGLYTKELVQVPWYTSTNGSRKTIQSEQPLEEPVNEFMAGKKGVDQRLRDLGYKM